jgi:hypothetical protein
MDTCESCDWDYKTPRGWTILQPCGSGLALKKGELLVIIDCSIKQDGNCYIHVSVSRPNRTPNHEEMKAVKNDFLGDRYAYSVWPPANKYVNIHKHCLHLWARVDGQPVLPEFSGIVDGVGRSI